MLPTRLKQFVDRHDDNIQTLDGRKAAEEANPSSSGVNANDTETRGEMTTEKLNQGRDAMNKIHYVATGTLDKFLAFMHTLGEYLEANKNVCIFYLLLCSSYDEANGLLTPMSSPLFYDI